MATLLAIPLAIVPRLVIVGSLVSAIRSRADPAALVLTVFAALCQLQALSRSDADHLALASTPAILLFARWIGSERQGSTALLGLVSVACISGSAVGFGQVAMQSRSQEEAIVQAVGVVAATTNRDEPIFAGLSSNRYTYVNPMMVYSLADRRPGSTFTMFNPGITNTEAAQRRMITELDASGTNILVLDRKWADYSEPENESRIPGSDVMDRYIAERFHPQCDFGAVLVSARNDIPGLDGGCPLAGGTP